MFIGHNTSREDLLQAIASEPELAEQFDHNLMRQGLYTTEELRAAVLVWIENGDECGEAARWQ